MPIFPLGINTLPGANPIYINHISKYGVSVGYYSSYLKIEGNNKVGALIIIENIFKRQKQLTTIYNNGGWAQETNIIYPLHFGPLKFGIKNNKIVEVTVGSDNQIEDFIEIINVIRSVLELKVFI